MPKTHTVTLAREDYEQFVHLSKVVDRMLRKSIQLITVDIGENTHGFDPREGLDEFARLIKKNPESRPNFHLKLDTDEMNRITNLAMHCDNIDTLEADKLLSQDQNAGQEFDNDNDDGESLFDAERDILSQFASENLDDVVDLMHEAREPGITSLDLYNEAIKDASDNCLLICPECENAHLVKHKDLVGVMLKYTDTPAREMESCAVETVVCKGCGYTEETAASSGARKDAFCRLVANRLKLDLPLDRRDIYMLMRLLYANVNLQASLMVDVLPDYCEEVLVEPKTEFYDEDDIFTGSFVLDTDNQVMTEVFDNLTTLGYLQHQGGLLYRPSRLKDIPVNPFAEDLIDDEVPVRSANHVH